jgi:hypothetical protein
MAAWDTFNAFTRSLPPHEQDALKETLRNTRADLLAARSEEARVRIVADLAALARDILKPAPKK